MHRRDLLRATAAAAALSLLPRQVHAAWARAVAEPSGVLARSALTPNQRSLIAALADTIIPRTDTPGATDVGVPAFIDVIVADYYSDAERAEFLAGVDAMDSLARTMTGQAFAALGDAGLTAVMDALDKPADRNTAAVRGYGRIKGLVLHGYFTSERVQRDVVKTEIWPGRYDGSAPVPTRVSAPGARD